MPLWAVVVVALVAYHLGVQGEQNAVTFAAARRYADAHPIDALGTLAPSMVARDPMVIQ